MIKPIIAAAALSFAVSSAAWAVPAASTGPQLAAQSDLIKVGRGDRDKNPIKSATASETGTGIAVMPIGTRISIGVGTAIRLGHTTGATVAA